LWRLVDRDGDSKTALQIIIEEAVAAGVDEIAPVICPGDRDTYTAAATARRTSTRSPSLRNCGAI